jgi:pseudaminic acid synthase
MIINGRKIGSGEPPYIVAEISGNHMGNIDRAFLLMGMAAGAGADAVKFQAYTPDTITLDARNNPEFVIKGGPWQGRYLYDLYQATQTPFEWFPKIFESARYYGQTAFASVFDKSSVDMLEKLGCPAYKIASMEIVDIPLIKYAAATGKPLIISTGMASEQEIYDAAFAADLGQTRKDIAFLHCVSGYPSEPEEARLSGLSFLQKYAFKSGISDHSKGCDIPIAATALGASIIEKHLMGFDTLDGVPEDADFSLNPDEFRAMCGHVRAVWKAMQPSVAKSEEASKQLRRSLYVTENMRKDDIFSENNVRSIRPCYGLPPKHLPNVLGKKAKQHIERGTALSWSLVDRAS